MLFHVVQGGHCRGDEGFFVDVFPVQWNLVQQTYTVTDMLQNNSKTSNRGLQKEKFGVFIRGLV